MELFENHLLARPHIPAPYAGTLRLGTCSWKYESWKGLIYDPSKRYAPHDYLGDYAAYYNTVEIDQWFWSLFPSGLNLPSPDTTARYAKCVPKDFLFTIKAPNAITLTHYYAKQPLKDRACANQPNPYFLDVDLMGRFLDLLEPLREKIAAVMLQFEYLNRNKMASMGAFLERLSDFFDRVSSGYPFAIEIRNPNYLKKPLFDFLRERNVSTVLLDGYYMPPIAEVCEQFNVDTGKRLIVRLHGPNRSDIEKETGGHWNRIVQPQNHGLATIVSIIRRCKEGDREVIVNVNNHYEGCAPLTIRRLLERLNELPEST